MARRSKRSGGGSSRRSRGEDDDDRPRRGGRGRARPSGGGSTGVIVGVVVAMAIIGIGAAVVMGGKSNSDRGTRRKKSKAKSSSAASSTPAPKATSSGGSSLTPEERKNREVFAVVTEAKAHYRKNDITSGDAKAREITSRFPAYEGDAWDIMGSGIGQPNQSNKETKKDYYRKAIAAYEKPGAKSSLYIGDAARKMRVGRLHNLLKMIDRQAGAAP